MAGFTEYVFRQLRKIQLSTGVFDAHMREILIGAGISFLMVVVGEALVLGFNIFLANSLGPSGTGQFFLALTIVTIATVLAQAGLDKSLLRFIAANTAINNRRAVKGLYDKGVAISFFTSVLSMLTVFAAAPFFASVVFGIPELSSPIRWMSIAILPLTLMRQHGEMLKGLKKMREAHLVDRVIVPFCSIIGFVFLHELYGVTGAVWAYTAAAVIAFLAGRFFWMYHTQYLKNVKGYFSTSELLAASIPLFWVSFLDILTQWMGILALGIFCSEKEVGIFTIASNTALVISVFLFSVNSIAAPKYAALYKKKEIATLGKVARESTMLMIVLSIPLLLVFIFSPGWIMSLYGSDFQQGAILLSILSLGHSISVASGSVGLLLVMSGNERLMMNVVIAITVLGIVANIILVPLAGSLGAAIAASLCIMAKNVINTFLVRQKLGFFATPLLRVK